MKVGDKVIVDPRLHGCIWCIPVEEVKGKIITIISINNPRGFEAYCCVKESGYILAPQKTEKQEEKILVNNLLKRINQLPPWSFGWLETINGSIFQGRYLKADYSQNTGWRFNDYFH